MTARPSDATHGKPGHDGAPLARSSFVAELNRAFSNDALGDPEPPRRALEIPFATIGKILLVAFVLWAIFKLSTLITLMLVAVVLAIAFEPLVEMLERVRLPRWAASLVVVLTVLAVVVAFLIISGASLASQGRVVGQRLLAIEKDLVERLPPYLGGIVTRGKTTTPDASDLAGYAVVIGGAVANALLVTAIASILTLYLLIDGRRTWEWVVAYVPARNRARAHATAEAGRRAVRRYVLGNVTTSVFATMVVFVALWLLHVPAALLLALLAGVCDFVPVLGFAVSSVPAVLLALTVSAGTAIAVAAVYIGYHLAENYFIGPRVYGGQLRLSNLAVLLAFAVGAELGGVVGALLALPVAAMYPVVEEIWLGKYLGRDAVETHKRLDREAAE
jgi:predicted PurR-regulated permease PerM